MIRRINFYAGPGAGKSVIATRIFSELKKLGYNIEYVSEYIKTWAHQGKVPKSFDQLHIFSKQLRREDLILPHVDLIVTDSPILLNTIYSQKYGCPYYKECINIGIQFEELFPAIHIFLDRAGVNYQEKGRYETLSEAKEMDKYLYIELSKYIKMKKMKTIQYNKLLDYIIRKINRKNYGKFD